MKLQAAIFDSDGVVVDTVPLHFQAWKRMFNEHGKKFEFDDYIAKVDGIPRTDGARAILTDLSEEALQKACAIKQGYFIEFLNKGIPVHESTVKLVKVLRAAGVKAVLISSSKNLAQIIKSGGTEGLWDVVISGHDITKGKPDPQIFQMAADRSRTPHDRCLVFEDAVLGVEAAKNACMKCIGIDRHGHPERLAKADLVVKDLAEVDLGRIEQVMGG